MTVFWIVSLLVARGIDIGQNATVMPNTRDEEEQS